MKVIEIEIPTPLSEIEDVEDDNIDVFVELEDGTLCTVVVSTPKNYYSLMEKEQKDYYCGVPDIIVKKLTIDNIERAIKEYASDDAYWLKFYHISGGIDINKINEVISIEEKDREIIENKEYRQGDGSRV